MSLKWIPINKDWQNHSWSRYSIVYKYTGWIKYKTIEWFIVGCGWHMAKVEVLFSFSQVEEQKVGG